MTITVDMDALIPVAQPEEPPNAIGIVHPVLLSRQLLSLAFANELQIDVQFATPTIAEIPQSCSQLDLLILTIDDPQVDNEDIAATIYWQVRFPKCKILAIGPKPSQIELRALLQSGINGYAVQNSVDFVELRSIIDRMWAGNPGLCSSSQKIWDTPSSANVYFTPRERQVISTLRKLGTRHRKEAAHEMGINYGTYTEYVRRICNKLGVAGIDDILTAFETLPT